MHKLLAIKGTLGLTICEKFTALFNARKQSNWKEAKFSKALSAQIGNARRENSHKKAEATFTLNAANVTCGMRIQAQSQCTGVNARGVTSGVAILKSEASKLVKRFPKIRSDSSETLS